MDTQLVLPGFTYVRNLRVVKRRTRKIDPSKGHLIVFEGADRTGKTTLSKELAAQLQAYGYKCMVRSFPGHDSGTLGKVIYDIHHKSGDFASIKKISQAALQVAHISAHIDEIENQIIPAIAAGYIVILDRFWWSSWVYGVINGVSKSALKLMIRLEREYWGKLKPHIIFSLQRELPVEDQYSQYHELVGEYEALADREVRRSRIEKVENNSSTGEQIAKLITLLGCRNIINEKKGSSQDDNSEVAQPDLVLFNPVLQTQELPPAQETSIIDETAMVVHTPLSEPAMIVHVPLSEPAMIVHAPLSEPAMVVHAPLSEPAVKKTIYINRLSPAKHTVVFDTYWYFAAERQQIFFNRLNNQPPPWTLDPILQDHKFTNAYRASDRVSQYLIKQVIYHGEQTPEELFFRIILFKVFNRIQTWELLCEKLGSVAYRDFSFREYDNILSKAIDSGQRIYSAAYIMPSGGPNSGESRKHRMHLRLIERMMKEELPLRISELRSMAKAFELLRSYPTIGDFLAYQYVTDLNYSTLTNFDEMSFVVPGPGAKDGIRKCFRDLGGLNEAELIKQVTDIQHSEFERLNIRFLSLWGRDLQLIDCQNLFCEVDKYARVKHPDFAGITGRTKIKQKLQANLELIRFWYPPKWKINEKIPAEVRYVP